MKISGLMLFPLLVGGFLDFMNYAYYGASFLNPLTLTITLLATIVGSAIAAGLNFAGLGGNTASAYFVGILTGASVLWLLISWGGALSLLYTLPFTLGTTIYVSFTIMYFVGAYDMTTV